MPKQVIVSDCEVVRSGVRLAAKLQVTFRRVHGNPCEGEFILGQISVRPGAGEKLVLKLPGGICQMIEVTAVIGGAAKSAVVEFHVAQINDDLSRLWAPL